MDETTLVDTQHAAQQQADTVGAPVLVKELLVEELLVEELSIDGMCGVY